METATVMQSCAAAKGAWPIRLEASGRGPRLLQWAHAHRNEVDALLDTAGAVLLPGLKLNGSSQFEEFISALFDAPLLEYRNRSTPRMQVKGNIYTSTEYPAEESIPLHNENAYTHEWAMRLAFFSVVAASEGGCTPIADSRRVYQRIPADIRNRFETLGVMYVRNYGAVDLPWQEVFQTTDVETVNAYCRDHGIEYEWHDDGGLTTREVCQGTAAHPRSGEMVWFNQAHLFHLSNYRPEIQQSLLATFGEARLPRNTYYGDGSPIPEETLAVIRQALEDEKVRFPWGVGDVMLLDNMLVAHGRDPYIGARKVLVGMARPYVADRHIPLRQ